MVKPGVINPILPNPFSGLPIKIKEYKIRTAQISAQLYSVTISGTIENVSDVPITLNMLMTVLPFGKNFSVVESKLAFRPASDVIKLAPKSERPFKLSAKVYVPNPPRDYYVTLMAGSDRILPSKPVILLEKKVTFGNGSGLVITHTDNPKKENTEPKSGTPLAKIVGAALIGGIILYLVMKHV